jgi:putative endonuclease
MLDRSQHSSNASLELTQRPGARCCVYIVRCRDDTFYTGWTNDLEKRMKVHNEGRGARYTRARCPVELVYCEEFASKNEAMSRERSLKKMTRAAKRRLIEEKAKERACPRRCL